MNISFIGAGKVGTAFGKYISDKVQVMYYYDLAEESARNSADYVGCETAEIDWLVNASDVVFITTSDNVIESVAEIIASKDINMTEKTFVHMSGALTSEELLTLKVKGAKVCSMHPLQTFSNIDKAVKDLETAYFSIEGDDDLPLALIKLMGNPHFTLTKDQKNKYHLSACIFSNYLCTLMNYGSRMLQAIGIDEENGLKAMKPLVEATLSNILLKGTKEALTGPIQRGDTKTIVRHMNELEGLDLKAYQLLGHMTTNELIMDDNKKRVLEALWRENDEE